ncbi:putative DNA-binding domain-containing protein [Zavarzinia compransoris]|uniref:Putative DNA-binding domain-containing protein n=1 Tax=Zavarzinia compransoris TaxID=1264899 RepID=A0A317DYD4_9PROT|nr:putative DNA-binding domain-containing protein [Zavarzinia compransoris]PWR19679.1 hypothetical protein DKG75_14515 [Zavarzinia compransoris]TDP43377.1 putative DNA-binding protein [Zavarzinia compransoris]
MTALRTLQEIFARDLLGTPGLIEPLVADGPRAGRSTRADVYRHAYAARLIEVLGTDFPVTAALLGPAGFEAAARAYLAEHPSEAPSVRWLGRHLPAHLRLRGSPAAADMAAFEWALAKAFDAADGGTVTVETLAGLAPAQWAGLRPRFQPGFSRLAVDHAVQDAWAAHHAGGALALPALDRPLSLLVWRRALDIQYRPAAAGEDDLIAALTGGGTFGEAVETAGIDPGTAVNLLAGWCVAGLVGNLDF